MTILCKYIHRLELQVFFNFCVVHLPFERDIETKKKTFSLDSLARITVHIARVYAMHLQVLIEGTDPG